MKYAPLALFFLTSCATAAVDMTEPRRVMGSESAVRVDAEISGEEIESGGHVPIAYSIRNQRSEPIAIADLVPQSAYDAETHMITVTIGSEVPGNLTLPRLLVVAPGETRTFSAVANLGFTLPRVGEASTDLRIKVNFLGDLSGRFQELIGMPEKAIADAKLADELFPLWLERNEVVYTNAVPMRWKKMPEPAETPSRLVPARRRGSGD